MLSCSSPAGAMEPRRLTQDAWPDSQPAWSPAGDRVSFVSRREGRRHCLVLLALEDRSERVLCRDVAAGRAYAWAPDGRRIAYTATEGRLQFVRLTDVESGQSGSIGAGGNPAFSPSGDRLAYVNDKDVILYSVTDRTTANLTQETRTAVLSRVAWSADGTVLFCAKDGDLWRLDVSTKQAACVFDHAADGAVAPRAHHPVVDRSGKKVFFSLVTDGLYAHATDNVLACYDTESGKVRRLADANGWSLAPGGKQTVYSIGGTLYSLDLASGAKVRVGEGNSPAVSPDGRSVLYLWRSDPQGENDVWIRRLE
jgi:Tol biopolymer transport system component